MRNLAGGITVALVLFGLFSAAQAMPPPGGPPPFLGDEELRGLFSEATALALIHDLALTPEQRGKIKGILKPVRADFDLMDKEEKSFREEQIKPRLKQVIADLKAGKNPVPATEVKAPNMEALRSRMAALRVKADQAYEGFVLLLSSDQKEKLRNFRFENYLGPLPGMQPERLPGMEPLQLIREVRGYSQEELEKRIEEIESHEAARPPPPGEKESSGLREQRVKIFIDLLRKIHDMPQAEFEAKTELLEQELAELSPPPPHGPEGDRGPPSPPEAGPVPPPGGGPGGDSEPPPPPGPPPCMKRGFDPQGVVFSKSFYEAL
jgi:hypothetical protein